MPHRQSAYGISFYWVVFTLPLGHLPNIFCFISPSICFISPTNLLHFPNKLLRFPNKLLRFPNKLLHFPNQILISRCNVVSLCQKLFVGLIRFQITPHTSWQPPPIVANSKKYSPHPHGLLIAICHSIHQFLKSFQGAHQCHF